MNFKKMILLIIDTNLKAIIYLLLFLILIQAIYNLCICNREFRYLLLQIFVPKEDLLENNSLNPHQIR